ncbi:hypothetical protein [Pseudoduganella sp. R-34]|jgi:hypothetical protein|uniref:hypothetical protein n=1 Tax=Pseudoduganella sp. R-34 TaxID=3404062 RepID=UPI003CF22507
MSTTQNPSQNPFDWMTRAGVGAADVEWLSQMDGSLELHTNENRTRVERIYTKAMAGMLASASPVEIMRSMKLN